MSARPAIDLEFLEQYRELDEPGKPSVVQDLFVLVLESTPKRIETLRSAVKEVNVKAVGFEAHAIKNVAGNVGARTLAALCEELEHLARNVPDLSAERLTRAFDRIDEEWKRAKGEIERLQVPFPASP